MKLTQTHIRQAVGPAAYQRGLAYFEQGRVMDVEVESDERGYVLHAGTSGSAGAFYEQDVLIAVSDDDIDIDGECTCPVGYNCKHVAAVCCAWAAVPGQGNGNGVAGGEALLSRWLEQLARAGGVEPAEAAAADEFLIYLLSVESARGRDAVQREELAVEVRVVKRRGKDGKPTRGRKIELHDVQLGHGGLARARSALDRDIAGLLVAGGDYWVRPAVRGRTGFHALELLIESGRCHWAEAANPPLSHGPARSLELTWRRHDRRHLLELEAEVAGGGLVVPTEPPLYLDPLAHRIGPLDTRGLNFEQLLMLDSAPAVPLEQAGSLANALAARYPHLPLPPPAEVAVRENAGNQPVPCATLRGVAGEGGVEARLTLDFRYGADRVHASPPAAMTLVQSAAGLVRVHREPHAEVAAHARLAALGFERLSQGAPGEAAGQANYVAAGAREIERLSRWSAFLHSARTGLAADGWEIVVEPSFPLSFESGEWLAEIGDTGGAGDWFSLGFRLRVGEQELPLIDVLLPILDTDWSRLPETVSVPLGGGRCVDVPAARLRPLLDVLRGLFEREPAGGADVLRLSRMDAAVLAELEAQGVTLEGGREWRELAARLADFDGIRPVEPDPGLAAELRPYQLRGLAWLQFLREYGFNGILADDMGLGKTVQTLAHLLAEKRAGRLTSPVLVVAPTSLMGNWRREAERFAPDLMVEVLHGQTRHARFDNAGVADLLLTTYPLLSRDAERLQELAFHSVVLDEAQSIKNPRAKAAQVVRSLRAEHRLCLTGTPLENHLGELWALFDFLMPGFLGDAESFRRLYRTPIETHGDRERQAALARRVAPFLLRRTKQAVAAELPPKTEIVERIELGPAQAELYESIRVTVDARVREAIARQGLARSHLTVLDALLKLRQVCCDPRLLPVAARTKVDASAKLEVLLALLDELLAEGRKVLVFSQFTSMLALVEEALDARAVAYTKLTGQTKHRDAAIERFRSGEVDLFLISLKAGGVGLNLAEADTVIHYDPWWNPAVEAQATDRAHRIGQTQPVFVYKLIVENSVEEKMLELQAKKRALAAGVYAGQEGEEGPLIDAETLARLFEPLR